MADRRPARRRKEGVGPLSRLERTMLIQRLMFNNEYSSPRARDRLRQRFRPHSENPTLDREDALATRFAKEWVRLDRSGALRRADGLRNGGLSEDQLQKAPPILKPLLTQLSTLQMERKRLEQTWCTDGAGGAPGRKSYQLSAYESYQLKLLRRPRVLPPLGSGTNDPDAELARELAAANDAGAAAPPARGGSNLHDQRMTLAEALFGPPRLGLVHRAPRESESRPIHSRLSSLKSSEKGRRQLSLETEGSEREQPTPSHVAPSVVSDLLLADEDRDGIRAVYKWGALVSDGYSLSVSISDPESFDAATRAAVRIQRAFRRYAEGANRRSVQHLLQQRRVAAANLVASVIAAALVAGFEE